MTQRTADSATSIAVERVSARSQRSVSGLIPTLGSSAERFVSPERFRQITGWSESTIRRRIRDRSLPAVQPGGPRTLILIDLAALNGTARGAMPVAGPESSDATPAGEPNLDDNPTDPKSRQRGPTPRWKNFT